MTAAQGESQEPIMIWDTETMAATTPAEGSRREVEQYADIGWISIAGCGLASSEQPNIAILAAPIEAIEEFVLRNGSQKLTVEARGQAPIIVRETLIDDGDNPELAYEYMKWHAKVKEGRMFTAAVRLGAGLEEVRLIITPRSEDDSASKNPPIFDPRRLSVYTVHDTELQGKTVNLQLPEKH